MEQPQGPHVFLISQEWTTLSGRLEMQWPRYYLHTCVVCLVVTILIVYIAGCAEKAPPDVPEKSQSLIYITRELPSGRFIGYVAEDPRDAKTILTTIQQDFQGKRRDPSLQYTLSTNHILLFCDEQGEVVVKYNISGDHWIGADDDKYLCQHSLPAIRALVKSGRAKKISPDELRQRYPSAVPHARLKGWRSVEDQWKEMEELRIKGTN